MIQIPIEEPLEEDRNASNIELAQSIFKPLCVKSGEWIILQVSIPTQHNKHFKICL